MPRTPPRGRRRPPRPAHRRTARAARGIQRARTRPRRDSATCLQLAESLGRRIRLQDPRLGLHDLAERPERDPVAVWQAAPLAPAHEIRPAVDLLAKLPRRDGSCRRRAPHHRHQLRRRLAQARANVSLQERELGFAADEERLARSSVSTRSDCAPSSLATPISDPALPFAATGSSGSKPIARSAERIVGCVHDHRADRSCSLQARGGVDHVARDYSLASLRPRSQCDDRLTCGHCSSDGDVEPSPRKASIVSRIATPPAPRARRRPRGDRRPEDGHHGVADELLDRTAEALDVGLHALVVRTQRRAHILRVARSERPVNPTRSTKSTDTTFAPLRPLSSASGCRTPGRNALARILLATRRANDHAPDLRSGPGASMQPAGSGSSSSSASRRCRTLRESTPTRRC